MFANSRQRKVANVPFRTQVATGVIQTSEDDGLSLQFPPKVCDEMCGRLLAREGTGTPEELRN